MDTTHEDALSIARRIREGSWSATAACERYISRIQSKNGRFQAFVQEFEGKALKQARELERLPKASPLAGVPIAIKDANAIRGSFMRLGSVATQHFFTPV